MSNTCGLCNRTYVWPADLKRRLKSKHGQQKSTLKQQQPYTLKQQQPYTLTLEQHPYTFTQSSSSNHTRLPQSSSHHQQCYGEYQTLYGTVDGVDVQQGLPDLDTLDPREKHLSILDDLMDETDQRVASLLTKKSHHRNINVRYIVQNLFHREKHHRTISLNAHYMLSTLFK